MARKDLAYISREHTHTQGNTHHLIEGSTLEQQKNYAGVVVCYKRSSLFLRSVINQKVFIVSNQDQNQQEFIFWQRSW